MGVAPCPPQASSAGGSVWGHWEGVGAWVGVHGWTRVQVHECACACVVWREMCVHIRACVWVHVGLCVCVQTGWCLCTHVYVCICMHVCVAGAAAGVLAGVGAAQGSLIPLAPQAHERLEETKLEAVGDNNVELVQEILRDIGHLVRQDSAAAELARILREPHFQVGVQGAREGRARGCAGWG